MDKDIILGLMALAGVIFSAWANVQASRVKRHSAETASRTEKRAERRAKESRLAMELMYATCSLALVTAKKINGHQTNGDVEEAMEEAEKAQNAYISFARDESANNFAKI